MNEIFREHIDANYPVISHKSYNIKECTEHLISKKNIIGYVLNGSKIIDDGKIIQSGDIFYMSVGNYRVKYIADNNLEYEEIAINFTGDELRTIITCSMTYQNIQTIILNRKNVFVSEYVSESANSKIKAIYDDILSNNEVDDKDMTGILDKVKITELILTILCFPESKISEAIVKMLKCNHDNVKMILSEFVGEHFSISEMAEKCSMSVSQFKKIFVAIYGDSPHKWSAAQQLEKAAFLLRTTRQAIGDIAAQCKFSNPSHLIKRFKLVHNITPSEYRKQNKDE